MPSPLGFVPRDPGQPSLVVTAPRPAYRAPRPPANAWVRPVPLTGGGAPALPAVAVERPDSAYLEALTTRLNQVAAGAPATPPATADCGCRP